jgi:gas vesicle protein
MEQLEEERAAKQEALLDLPEEMGETHVLVQELQDHVRDLQARIQRDNSWQSKLKNYLIGGLIGAIIGFALSLLFS